MLSVVEPWHRLPREVGDAPSLETLKARLDGALSSLIWVKMSLLMAGGWTRWPAKVPSHPNHSLFCDSTKHFYRVDTMYYKCIYVFIFINL